MSEDMFFSSAEAQRFFLSVGIFFLVWLVKECTKEQQPEQRRGAAGYFPDGAHGQRYTPTSFSHPNNNHDHVKHPHASRGDATAEVCRMQQCGYDDSARLNVYYNRQLKAWYVGRGAY